MSSEERVSDDCNYKTAVKRPKFETVTLSSSNINTETASNSKPTQKQLRRIEKARKREELKKELLPEFCTNMMPSKIGFHIKDGIRFLDSYWSVFGSYAKGRWVGRQLHEVFTIEFLSHNKYYSKAAIRKGRLFVNGKQMTNPDYRFRSSDRIVHLGHRHEHPILAEPSIRVIADTDKFLVIDKPPSMPVHPCGQYKVHSVLGLLRTVYKIDGLKVCHRLDRTTSGVLIFAKDHITDITFKDDIVARRVSKEYICKVNGIFPDNEVTCEAPIGVLSVMMGIQFVTEDGKFCLSKFRRLAANKAENTSLVLCNIETGRTHQIRVHLQYLGYPIVNDYFYNDEVWGSERGKGGRYGKSVNELRDTVQARHRSSGWIEEQDPGYEARLKEIANNDLQEPDEIDLNKLQLDELPTYDPLCLGCNVRKRIPDMKHMRMMLHCWRYRGQDWQFEAPLPDWAAELRTDKEIEKATRPLIIPPTVEGDSKVKIPASFSTSRLIEESQMGAQTA